jgi:hypothetical protein
MDRRDKVFGLLGLFPENVRLAVNPSYQDSVREVHLRTAFLILQKTKCFFTLNHTHVHNAHEQGCPSWVPSWDADDRYYADDEFRIAQRRAFSASGSSQFSISMDGDGALCVSAVRVDKVSAVFREIEKEDPAGVRNDFLNWSSSIRQWNRENHNILGPESIIRRSMLVPILLYNCAPANAPSGFSKIDDLDLLDIERWLDLYPDMPENNEKLLRMTFTNCPSASIFKNMSSAVVGKALFVTEMDYVGVMSGLWPAYFSKDVPWELFVLAGGTHPVILSSISGKPSTYGVISEAFVPRIMQGEIVDGKQPIASQHWRRYSRDRERFRPPWEQINLV